MNSEQERHSNIIETSDCLEAVDVFRGWKNFLFVIVLVSLLLLQAAFWLVDIGYVKIDEVNAESASVKTERSAVAAVPSVVEPNKPVTAAQAKPKPRAEVHINFKQLVWVIRVLNFIVIPAAILYCLTLLFGLKVSLVGRLGGVSHVTRAFFLSLLMVILMLPWQRVFWGVITGALYTPDDLLNAVTITPANDTLEAVLYYMRFTVYWLVVVLLLIFAQMSSGKWAKAMLRRLEVL